MGKNQKNSNPSQGSYAGYSKQNCESKPTGSSGSTCASEPRSGQTGQQKPGQFRGQDASFRKPEFSSPSEKEAAANEDWEGGASRPAREAQAPAVKKNTEKEISGLQGGNADQNPKKMK